ncbi:acetolactate decarboxylase [Flagellimonas lutimaris]|uniref:acetolactate decarboxylase n=1 Tax=Flagellimonas lutimaris TaxID=475082 RepID=UPI003F5CCC63
MNSTTVIKTICLKALYLLCTSVYAQNNIGINTIKNKAMIVDSMALVIGHTIKKERVLFHYNFVDAFLAGNMYQSNYTYQDLLGHGNFGLAAANKIDGEVTILNGTIYQSKANGTTVKAGLKDKTSLAFVTSFTADSSWAINEILSKEGLEESLKKHFRSTNHIYAIMVNGTFNALKNRTYPIVSSKPYPEFSEVVKTQKVFDLQSIKGSLVGFYIPSFLKGVNIPGFHFHFVSNDEKYGGHVLELELANAKVEIRELSSYEVNFPENPEFQFIDMNKK